MEIGNSCDLWRGPLTPWRPRRREIDPDVILCVGQAGGRDAVTPERIAVNLQDASIPDNAGNQPVDLPVVADGANAYFTSLPVKAMQRRPGRWTFPAACPAPPGPMCATTFFTGCCTGIGTRRSGWASSMCRSCRSRAAPICPWIPSSGPCRPCWRQFEKTPPEMLRRGNFNGEMLGLQG